jgi:hypothetical protein
MGHRPRARIWELYLDGDILLFGLRPVKGWQKVIRDAVDLKNSSPFNNLHRGKR